MSGLYRRLIMQSKLSYSFFCEVLSTIECTVVLGIHYKITFFIYSFVQTAFQKWLPSSPGYITNIF